jgi:adenosylcobinamide-phosphate guanylyltransferase
MIAIILAGGKSSRMEKDKGVIKIGGKPLIDSVVESVKGSKVEDLFIATSLNAPMTKKYCDKKRYNIIETTGKGYHEDLHYLLSLHPGFVSIACDIPFLKAEHINSIIDFYNEFDRGNSITGVVPLDIIPSYVVPSYVFEYEERKLVAVGLNIVTNARKNLPFIFTDPLLAININTTYDLEIAKTMQNGQDKRSHRKD